jgi:hypothetical protein
MALEVCQLAAKVKQLKNTAGRALKSLLTAHIMLRDLLTQIACNKKPSLTWYAPEHVDSGKRKMKIAHGRSVYQL